MRILGIQLEIFCRCRKVLDLPPTTSSSVPYDVIPKNAFRYFIAFPAIFIYSVDYFQHCEVVQSEVIEFPSRRSENTVAKPTDRTFQHLHMHLPQLPPRMYRVI